MRSEGGWAAAEPFAGFLAASWASLSSEASLAAEHIRQFERDTLADDTVAEHRAIEHRKAG